MKRTLLSASNNTVLATIRLLSILLVPILVLLCSSDKKSGNPVAPVRGSVSGMVLDQSGSPLKGVYISVEGSGYSSISDSSGTFRIPSVPSGKISLRFLKSGYRDTVLYNIVEISRGESAELSESVTMVPNTCTLRGSVVRDDVPLGGAGVGIPYQPYTTVTDNGGSFELSGVSTGTQSVYAAASDGGWGEVQTPGLSPGEIRDGIVIELEEMGGSVEGRVADANGNPISGAIVTTVGGAVRDTSDDEGKYRLDGVPSGVPVSVQSGTDHTVSGLIVANNGSLGGVELTPQSGAYGLGLHLPGATYFVPATGDVTVYADVRDGQSDAAAYNKVAAYLWDRDNDGVYDTVTSQPMLSAAVLEKVRYGIVTENGDTLGGGIIEVNREHSQPRLKMGPDQQIKVGEEAVLNVEVICRTGGVMTYEWDFDGDGTYDWKRTDNASTTYPYFAIGTYNATFKATSVEGEWATGSIKVSVSDGTVDPTTLEPPTIVSPKDGDEVDESITVSWNDVEADSYSVYMGNTSPPTTLVASKLTSTSTTVSGIKEGLKTYLQVHAFKGDKHAIGTVVSVTRKGTSVDPTPKLTSLALSMDGLTPAFDPNVKSYTMGVGSSVESIRLTLHPQDGATVVVKANGTAVQPDEDTYDVPLVTGTNTVEIVLDNGTVATYTIEVIRGKSSDATLQDLRVNRGSLSPNFSSDTYTYDVTVGSSVDRIRIQPTTNHSAATVRVNGETVSSGSMSRAIDLEVGTTTRIPVVVTAEDGSSTKTYTIDVERSAHSILLTVSSGIGGSTTPSGQSPATSGQEVTIGASVANGYGFGAWEIRSGDVTIEDSLQLTTKITIGSSDAVVYARFEPKPYTLKVSSRSGGSSDPSGEVTVYHGVPFEIKALANGSHNFDRWRILSGSAAIDDSMSATTTITLTDGNTEVEARFRRKRYTLTVRSESGGNATPSGDVTVQHGVRTDISASPNNSNQFERWTVTSGSAEFDDSLSASTMVRLRSGDATVEAVYKRKEYTLTLESRNGGSIDPSGDLVIRHGQATSVSADPNNGFLFGVWRVTSGSADIADSTSVSTTIRLRSGDATVQARFRRKRYSLTVEAGNGGDVSPSGTVNVSHGVRTSINATANGSHIFNKWVVTNGTADFGDENSASTTVRLRSGDATIRATFATKQYTLSVTSTGGGSTDPSGDQTVNHGANTSITASPATGYQFDQWSVTSGTATIADQDASSTTVRLTSGDATVQADFNLKQYTLTVNSSIGGSTNPSGNTTVNHGTTKSISATASTGYEFDEWTVESGSATFGNSNNASTTVTLTSGNATIKAGFLLKTYTLTVNNDGNGTTNPNGGNTVTHGVAKAISASAGSEEYMFKRWSVTSGSPTIGDASESSTNVTLTQGNATIKAEFGIPGRTESGFKATGLVEASDGNFFIAGKYTGGFSSRSYIQKTNSSLTKTWTKEYTSSIGSISNLSAGSNGSVVTTNWREKIFTINSGGSVASEITISPNDFSNTYGAIEVSFGYIVYGYTNNSSDFPGYIAGVNSSGSVLWTKTLNMSNTLQKIKLIKVSSNKMAFFATFKSSGDEYESYLGSFNFSSSGISSWVQSQRIGTSSEGIYLTDVCVGNTSGDVLGCGYTKAASPQYSVMVKINSSGTITLKKTYSASYLYGVENGWNGGYVLVGRNKLNDYDGIFYKVNEQGAIGSEKEVGGASKDDYFSFVSKTGTNNYGIVGWGRTYLDEEQHIWVLQISDNGTVVLE